MSTSAVLDTTPNLEMFYGLYKLSQSCSIKLRKITEAIKANGDNASGHKFQDAFHEIHSQNLEWIKRWTESF